MLHGNVGSRGNDPVILWTVAMPEFGLGHFTLARRAGEKLVEDSSLALRTGI